MFSKLSLSLEDAKAVVESAERYAAEKALPVSIAVCDEGGHLLVMHRHTFASPVSARIAVSKCTASALTRRETRHFQGVIKENPAFVTMPMQGLVEGGIPISIDGQVVGGIGVSGATSTEDAEIARAGLAGLPAMVPVRNEG